MEHIVLVNSLCVRVVNTTGWTTCKPPSLTYLHIRSLISYWQRKTDFTAAPKFLSFPRARSTSWKQTFFVVVFSGDRNKRARERKRCQILAPVVSLHSTSSVSIPALQSQTSGDAYKRNQDSPHKVWCCIHVPQGGYLKSARKAKATAYRAPLITGYVLLM